MKTKILSTIFTFVILSSLAFQTSPYARRIRPFSSTPVACQENEIGYNMTSHALVICTNSGFVALATGGSGGTAAPTSATYITKTADATLTSEFALASLVTGILKNTTTTGIPTIAAAGTDYEVPLTFSNGVTRTVNAIAVNTDAGLPTQTGNSGKFLTTNGTVSSWNTVSSGITNSASVNVLMKSDGTNAVGSRIVDDGSDIIIGDEIGSVRIGDINEAINATRIEVDDPFQKIILQNKRAITIGDPSSAANSNYFTIDDSSSDPFKIRNTTGDNGLIINHIWNSAAAFDALRVNVVDTSSDITSALFTLDKSGTLGTEFEVTKDGKLTRYGAANPADGQVLIGGTSSLRFSAGTIDGTSPISISNGNNTIGISCSTCALTSETLAQFAATSSFQLAGVLSDESGSGVSLFATLSSIATNDVLTWNGSNWINQAVSSGGLGSGGNVNMTVANASSTGTTTNRLAKLTGAPSTALITSTSDTENAVGVCTSGCGTTGSATIAILGQVSCDFDNATTAGNYVTISAITAGKCHDAGSAFPTSSAAYGRVLTTNGASGTFSIELMTPDIAFQNAGNGKSKPGTPANSFQFNSSNTFGGSNMFEEDADTIAMRDGSTSQTLQIYDEFTSGSNYQRLQFWKNAGGQFEILSTNQTQGAMELAFKVNGASGALVLGTGDLRPASNRLYNLGSSTSNMFNQLFIFRIDLNGDGLFFTSGPQFVSGGGGWLQMKDTANSANLTRISMGDPSSSGVSIVKPASSTFIEAKNGDNSGYVPFAASNFKTGANVIYGSGTPAISGNATLNTNSKDSAGKITSTGTGVSTAVLTFSVAFSNAPACIVTNETTSNLVRPVSTTTTLTINATVVTGDSISYICVGY